MSEWETFCDVSYYHLWRVRRKTERGFDDGFHLNNGEEARDLVELLNRMERERVEAQEDLEFRRGLSKVQEEYLETARRERDEAIRRLENLKATAIHTCHDQCQRPMCVLRRERDEAMEALLAMRDHYRQWSIPGTLYNQVERVYGVTNIPVPPNLPPQVRQYVLREDAARWESSSDAMERAGAEQARRADENREWALKAERERDEAMELLASEKITRNHIIKRSVEVERERNEAREALEHITEYGTEEINAAVELRQKLASALVKRDEALEALMQIEDLFIDGTDIYADREKMGSIAREALRARNE